MRYRDLKDRLSICIVCLKKTSVFPVTSFFKISLSGASLSDACTGEQKSWRDENKRPEGPLKLQKPKTHTQPMKNQ